MIEQRKIVMSAPQITPVRVSNFDDDGLYLFNGMSVIGPIKHARSKPMATDYICQTIDDYKGKLTSETLFVELSVRLQAVDFELKDLTEEKRRFVKEFYSFVMEGLTCRFLKAEISTKYGVVKDVTGGLMESVPNGIHVMDKVILHAADILVKEGVNIQDAIEYFANYKNEKTARCDFKTATTLDEYNARMQNAFCRDVATYLRAYDKDEEVREHMKVAVEF